MTNATTIIAESAVETAVKAPKTKTPKTPKTNTKTKAKAPAAKPAVAPEEPAKPEPILFEGFEVKEGTDITNLSAAMAEAAEAANAITRKDADLLGHYLSLGRAASVIAPQFKSTKLYGQALAKLAPASQTLDPALRSNCKWLFEALNDETHEGHDILRVLGVNDIAAYKSANPTVIKRDYNNAKKAAKIAAEAGVDVDDADAIKEAEKAMKEACKAEKLAAEKAEAANIKRQLTNYVKAASSTGYAAELILSDLQELVSSALLDPRDDAIALIGDFTKRIKVSVKK